MVMEPDETDLEARLASLVPPVALPPSVDDYAERLRGLDDVPEAEEETEIEETPRTGQFRVTFDEALIERDSAGRVVGLIGNGWRKTIGRDKAGRVVSISTETEELLFEEDDGDTE